MLSGFWMIPWMAKPSLRMLGSSGASKLLGRTGIKEIEGMSFLYKRVLNFLLASKMSMGL